MDSEADVLPPLLARGQPKGLCISTVVAPANLAITRCRVLQVVMRWIVPPLQAGIAFDESTPVNRFTGRDMWQPGIATPPLGNRRHPERLSVKRIPAQDGEQVQMARSIRPSRCGNSRESFRM